MIRQIFIFTAGSPSAQAHLDHSIKREIDFAKAARSTTKLTPEQIQAIKAKHGLFAWGAVEGPQNVNRWEKMQPGDWVLGVWDDHYQVISQVVEKTRDEKLAEAVWKRDEDGNAFEYMYFLTRPRFIQIPVRQAEPLPSRYQGFFRPSDESLQGIEQRFGSVDAFIERTFGAAASSAQSGETTEASQERSATFWTFQANPDYYDVRGALRHGGRITWQANQHAKEMGSGDQVWLYESGPSAGIVGICRIKEGPALRRALPHEKRFFREDATDEPAMAVVLEIYHAYDPAISRQVLSAGKDTRGLDVIRIKQGTNFRVRPEENRALLELGNGRSYTRIPHQFNFSASAFSLTSEAVIKAFEATTRDQWEDLPGVTPRRMVLLNGAPKPIKAVFRNVLQAANAGFTTNEAARILGALGFELGDASTVTTPQDLSLIGTWKTALEKFDHVKKAIEVRGGWAHPWSFKIVEAAEALLKRPFNLYAYVGQHQFPVKLRVEEYRTSSGTDGIESPWPAITNEEWIGKTRDGEKQNDVFKTWLRVSSIEQLQPPLTREDFTPYEPLSSPESLTNQNAFGYATVTTTQRQPEAAPAGAAYGLDEAMKDLFITREEFLRLIATWKQKRNLILQGPPGVGKTFFAKRLSHYLAGEKPSTRVEMVQFHQSYAYEDFIQGYRPASNGAGGFTRKDGTFLKFCEAARADTNRPYIFIIDEINRGNLSKIFGELLMLIEHDKRKAEFAVPLTYADERDGRFYVPDNVYLLGMMNTADRSIAMVDYALRRRFSFYKINPAFDTDAFRGYLVSQGVPGNLVATIVSRIGELNKRIENDPDLGPGFAIGHSYFCPNGPDVNAAWYRRVVDTEIRPLIEEYWFDKPSDELAGIGNGLIVGI